MGLVLAVLVGLLLMRTCAGPKRDYLTPEELHGLVMTDPMNIYDFVEAIKSKGVFERFYPQSLLAPKHEPYARPTEEELSRLVAAIGYAFSTPDPNKRTFYREGHGRESVIYAVDFLLYDGEFYSIWENAPLAWCWVFFDKDFRTIGYLYWPGKER